MISKSKIVHILLQITGLSLEDFMLKRNNNNYSDDLASLAKKVFVYYCIKEQGISLSSLATFFYFKTHTSVMYLRDSAYRLKDKDPMFNSILNYLYIEINKNETINK